MRLTLLSTNAALADAVFRVIDDRHTFFWLSRIEALPPVDGPVMIDTLLTKQGKAVWLVFRQVAALHTEMLQQIAQEMFEATALYWNDRGGNGRFIDDLQTALRQVATAK